MVQPSLQDLIQLSESETEKAVSRALLRQTVVDSPDVDERFRPAGPLVFNIANQADEFTPWGMDLKGRDFQLRSFWHTEPTIAGSVYTMSARMSVIEYDVIGSEPDRPNPKNTVRAAKRLLASADRGAGWQRFMMKLMQDVYTQDNGGFIEVIRAGRRPDSPVLGVAHLDSFRCTRTGDPEVPVIYEDRKGREHKMPWWTVKTVEDMPSSVETMYGSQVCAVTRALRAAQIIRDITQYKKEKVSGGFARAVHLVKGVTRVNIEDALRLAQEQVLNQNLTRYSQPIIIPTIDMEGSLSHIQLDLAALPDGYDEDVTMRWYVALLAICFGVDYQEFAPLPSGALGSGQQSEILHLKSGGKGPALMISTVEGVFNNSGVLPSSVVLKFRVGDVRMDEEAANARYLRGRDRAMRVQSGELDIEGARRVAVEDGDMTEDLFEQMEARPDPQPTAQPNTNGPSQVQGGMDREDGTHLHRDPKRGVVQ